MNYFFDEWYKYNIDIRKYKKDISSLTKKLFDNILNILPESKARFSYKVIDYFYKIFFLCFNSYEILMNTTSNMINLKIM